MKFKIQVVTVSNDGREENREIASLERDDLQPETLGLTLAQSKAILKDIHEIVVERQATDFLASYYRNQLRYARKHFGAFGAAVVRTSIAAGMIGRMIGKPRQAAAYGRTLMGALRKW